MRCASPPDSVAAARSERQVADADVVEEPQPLVDLAQDQPRDRALGVGQLDVVEPLDRPPRRHARDLVDAEAADLAPASDSGRSRAPPQSGHGRIVMYSSIFSRT